MIILDASIVITWLTKIQESLNFSDTWLSWVQNAYTLTIWWLLLLSARFWDIYGRKKMFLIWLTIFSFSSFLIWISSWAELFIIWRVLQGVWASILAPSTLALLSSNFEEGPERNKAVWYYWAMAWIGSSIWLVLGWLIADLTSWRVWFFINLPIWILLFLWTIKYIKETQKHKWRFDLLWAITSVVWMFLLVYWIINSASEWFTNYITILCIASSLVLLAIFAINEKYAQQPILPLSLFNSRERVWAYVARFFFIGSIMSFYFFSTQYLQWVLHFTPIQAWFWFLVNSIPNFLTALYVPKFTKKYWNKIALLIWLTLSFIWVIIFSKMSYASWFLWVILPFIIIWLGQWMSLSPLTVEWIAWVESKNTSAASWLVNVSHQIWWSIGLSILIVIFSHTILSTTDKTNILAYRIDLAIFYAWIMILVWIIITAFLIPNRKKV
jgi:EmrB/QacA subfamily drug resistance transporter